MGRKSRSKNKPKLQKYDLEVKGKIIDLRRFAYDIFVYSGKKFGIPEVCIPTCEIEENEYPHSNFIVIISRMTFRMQIAYRHEWCKMFKQFYELTLFSSYRAVEFVLREFIKSETFTGFEEIVMRVTTYLSAASELLLFLFTTNCNLFFNELSGFWADCVLSESKLFVKQGGLAEVYKRYNTPGDNSSEVFFNKFIPKHCIPYGESSTLCAKYMRDDDKFAEFHSIHRQQETLSARKTLLRDLKKKLETSKTDQASGTSIPINTGLGIPPHEQWLQSEINPLDVDIDASLQNTPSTSSRETARNRRTSNRKEKLRRKPSSRTSEKPSEKSSTDVAGASAASFTENFPIAGCRRKTRDYNEPIDKDSQKSSLLYNEDIERLKSSFISSVTVSPQSLSGTSSQEPLGDRKYPSSQKKTEKKKSSSRPTGDLQQLNISATSAMSPPILSGTSRRETDRDSDSRLEESLRQLSLCSLKRDTSDKKQK